MGYAKIISGGPDGRYTIELDYGESLRLALLEARQAQRIALELREAEVSLLVFAADEKEAMQRSRVDAAADSYIASTAGPPPPGSSGYSDAEFQFELAELRKLEAASAPIRQNLQALKFDVQALRRVTAALETFPAVTQRDAWCVDLTEDATPGAFAATVEVPGEPAITLLAPGARAWGPADGLVRARELMSPEQAFFNAAILPGWQKQQPTHRWGTATAIDYEADRMNVSLAPAQSSAQQLNINQSDALVSVPVVYLTCNARAFEVGDRVIVQFAGQDWSAPTVIGFLDNPKTCAEWPESVRIRITFVTSGVTINATRPWFGSLVNSGLCGLRWATYSPTANTALSADHALTVSEPEFTDSTPEEQGFYFDVSGGTFGDVWTGESPAFNYGGGDEPFTRVPAVDKLAEFVLVDRSDLSIGVIKSSRTYVNEPFTLPGTFGFDCAAANFETAAALSSTPVDPPPVISFAYPLTPADDIAGNPTIIVRNTSGRGRFYNFSSLGAQVNSNFNADLQYHLEISFDAIYVAGDFEE